MKLYLSSYGLGNRPKEFANLVGPNKRTAVIANAWDLSTPEERSNGLPSKVEMLRKIGLEPEELDLRNYFDRQAEIAEQLQKFGALWVLGGNSFVLIRAMHMSG